MRSSFFLIVLALAFAALASCSKNDSGKTGQSGNPSSPPVGISAGNPAAGSPSSSTSQTPPTNSLANNSVPPNNGNASAPSPVDPNRNGLANLNTPPANSNTSPPGLNNSTPPNGDPGRNLAGTPPSTETINKSSSDAKEMAAAAVVPTNKAGTELGDTILEIEGKDFDGVSFALSDYKGKVVMVDFWGDW